ncbi:DNA polymerase III beta subunit [Rhizobium sp. PP-F2F-G48]|uniref:DNA polymerase III subunit beta n=1 Tax=Rhizobium sp. PP-F2F-G48 TaxID=2135651 RepID=UPI0010440684|nr:DNA polymerase III subunit beta [Rhizobium sp. PP-F2F-G48]TCM56182.1 DNA polymerase III beta subunit [Rhizobium sp. PP-F2F-G48]
MAEEIFSVHRTQIFAAMQHVSRAVSGRDTIPILSHVLLTAEGEKLRIRGTNLDLQIEAECEALHVASETAIAIPAARLGDILRQLPESADVHFEKGRLNHQVAIRAGRSVFNISYLPATDMPDMAPRQGFQWTEVNGAAVAEAITKSSYAVSKLKDRPSLEGLCMRSGDGDSGIEICCLDGLALARIRLPDAGSPVFPARSDSYPHIILPMNTVVAVQKLFDDAKRPAEMATTESMASFRFDGVEIRSKLLDYIYPLYEKAIPPRTETTLVVSREVLLGAVKRVCAVGINMTGQKHRDGIRMKVQGGQIRVDLLNEEGGYAEDYVPAAITAPEGFTIACDAALFERTMSAIKATDVELVVTDAERAFRVEPVGRTNETHILMPLKPRFAAVD